MGIGVVDLEVTGTVWLQVFSISWIASNSNLVEFKSHVFLISDQSVA